MALAPEAPMSDDTFTANVNEVGKRLFFFAAPMYEEFSQRSFLAKSAELGVKRDHHRE